MLCFVAIQKWIQPRFKALALNPNVLPSVDNPAFLPQDFSKFQWLHVVAIKSWLSKQSCSFKMAGKGCASKLSMLRVWCCLTILLSLLRTEPRTLWGGGRHLSPCLPACFYLMERCEPPETFYDFCLLRMEFSLAWSTEWVWGQPELHGGTPSWKTNQPNRRMGFVSQYYQEGLPSTVWKQGVLLPRWRTLFFPRKPDL